jgi:uncharacterized protein
VYRFLRDELGATWIQLIPVIERLDPAGGRTLQQQGSRLSARSVRPEQFGRFLITIFDEWVRHDVSRVYVQTFEAAVRNWMGMPSSGMCVFEETCGLGLALEHNGDLYSCDHFVEPDFLLGNLGETPMLEMVLSEQQRRFGQDKRDALPRYCLECDVRFACHGECPKNRFTSTPDGQPGLNYLCAGWKAFFHRADEPIKMVSALMRMGRPAADVMGILADREEEWKRSLIKARRNDPCPCNSGLKYAQCHGWQEPAPGQRRRKRRRR